MEEATRTHFFNHGGDSKEFEDEKKNCHLCQIRAFSTHAQFPVTIINTQDNVKLEPKFRFMDSSVLGRGVEPTKSEFLTGCECVDGGDCEYNTCNCLQDVDDSSSSDNDDDDDDSSDPTYAPGARGRGGRKKAYAYHSHGARAGHLRSKVLASRDPIYECHESCACGPACANRVVERGRKIPLQIFRTADRGWGVRCPVDVRQGQFVDRYMGEVITALEAARRRAHSHIAQRKDVYLFALDKFSDPESFDERLRGPPLEVDGEFMSGPTRFVNHSCEPNMRIFARVGDHADKHLHDLALFAIRDIPRGEELTFDYVDGIDDSDNDALDPEKHKDMTPCFCGSKKCRGWLW
ncbi:SET domain protein [Whalleya microplaca]|nr:SET domain protein [Whalleya microplaca]